MGNALFLSHWQHESPTDCDRHSLHEDNDVVDLDAGHGAEGAAGGEKSTAAGGGHSSVARLRVALRRREPNMKMGDSLDEGGAAADLGADRVINLRKNLGVKWL